MESNGKFTLIVFNTCTQEYEEVIVTEEVYRTYCRTRWNIKDNDQSFFESKGFRVLPAFNGAEALKQVEISLQVPTT